MEVRFLYESSTTITLGWEPPAGVEWYLFYAGGKRVSNAPPVSKNGVVKRTIQFYKTPSPWEVVAITRRNGVMGVEVGYYPPKPTENSEDYGKDPYGNAVYSH